MIGIIETPFGYVDSYNVAITAGIIVTLVILVITYLKAFKKPKYLFCILSYLVILFVGQYFSSFVRLMNEEPFSLRIFKYTFDKQGSHFLGHVICFGLLYYPVMYFMRRFFGDIFGVEIATKEDIPRIGYITAFALPIQHIFNRIACISRGCCYGIEYDGFCSVRFPHNQELDHSVFPCQFLEILFMIILIILMLILYKKGKNVFSVMLIGFSITFFICEFFTYNPDKYKVLGLTFVQLFSFISLIIGVIHLCMTNRKRKN